MNDNRNKTQKINELLTKIGMHSDNYELIENERLEFLGDAVLKLIASDYLLKRFPTYTEGDLTKIRAILISDVTLTKIANSIDLGKYLRLGFHEEKLGGRTRASTLACAFEALLGALYVDGKFNELHLSLTNLLESEVTEIDQSAAKHNFKAILQEYTQAEAIDLPIYNVVKEEGPPHNRTFEIEVVINDEVCGFGTGKSKKEAHQKAAKMGVISLGLLPEELIKNE